MCRACTCWQGESSLPITPDDPQVYAAGSEDMDTLTFHAPILLRHLTFSEAKKMPISEIKLDEALKGLDMNMDQVSYLHHSLD